MSAARAPGVLQLASRRVIRAWCRLTVASRLQLRIEGIANLPRSGPVLIAARHYHHLYDGCVLLSALPRPAHLLVALDWVRHPAVRRGMESLCRLACWPVVLRPERLQRGMEGAYRADEVAGYLRRAARNALALLRDGEVLVIFPEAYPNIDPDYSPKAGTEDFLPFRTGFLRIAALAERDGTTRVAIVPAGLRYRRGASGWSITLRLGPPVYLDGHTDRARLAGHVEEQVRLLSR